MSEFKVGDRVKIREDLSECEEYSGTFVVRPMLDCRGQIATIEAQNDDRYLIDLDNHHWDWTKEMFEPIKNQDQQKIEELEQRIEKLEKCVMGEQNSLEKCENVSSMSKNSLLTEDERVILRNVVDDYGWIARDKDGGLHIFESKPDKEHDHWSISYYYSFESLCLFRKLFQFIKWDDNKPYNIEELLKGECGNE